MSTAETPGRTVVDAVLVTWNAAGTVGRCLRSLREHSGQHLGRVVVVDGGSTDTTLDEVAAADPSAQVLALGRNVGFAPGVNLGLARTSSELVLLLNPDTWVDTDLVGPLLEALADDPTAALAAPQVLQPDGTPDPYAARRLPDLRDTLVRETGLRRAFGARVPLLGRETARRTAGTQAVPFLTGAALLVRREVLGAGLDTTLPMYFEDVELMARCEQAGRPRLLVPSAAVQHDQGHASSRSPMADLLLAMEVGHAKWLYFRRFGGPGRAAAFSLLIALTSAVRLLVLTLAGRAGGPAAQRSRVLLRWSLTGKRRFTRRARAAFDPV